jgi:hypothetical protein
LPDVAKTPELRASSRRLRHVGRTCVAIAWTRRKNDRGVAAKETAVHSAAQACGVRRDLQKSSGFFLKAGVGLADESEGMAT